MFLPQRVDITKHLSKDGKDNVLEIDFASALLRAREIEKAHPEHVWKGFNGETARLAVRKAQYHWGWDWGPLLMTAGIWRAARLETYHARIEDLWTESEVASDLKSAEGTLFARIDGKDGQKVTFNMSLEGKTLLSESANVDSKGIASTKFKVDNPALWYPHGYGSQPLYQVSATLQHRDIELDQTSKKIGLRKAELIQEPDVHGKSFYFRINNVDVFCGGSDWIPGKLI